MPLGIAYACFLELAPYRSSRRCFMPGGRGFERDALLMLKNVSSVHSRCPFGHIGIVRAVLRISLICWRPGFIRF